MPIDIDWSATTSSISSKLQNAVSAGIQKGLESFSKTDFSKFEQTIHQIVSAQKETIKNVSEPQKINSGEKASLPSKTNKTASTKTVKSLEASIENLQKKYEELCTHLEQNPLVLLSQQLKDISSGFDGSITSLGESYAKIYDILQKAKEISKLKVPEIKIAGTNLPDTNTNGGAQPNQPNISLQGLESIFQKLEAIRSLVANIESSNKTALSDSQISTLVSQISGAMPSIGDFVEAIKQVGTSGQPAGATNGFDASKLQVELGNLSTAISALQAAIANINSGSVHIDNPDSIKPDLTPLTQQCEEIIKKLPDPQQGIKVDFSNAKTIFDKITGALDAIKKAIESVENICKNGTIKTSGGGNQGSGSGNNNKKGGLTKDQRDAQRRNQNWINAKARSFGTAADKYGDQSVMDLSLLDPQQRDAFDKIFAGLKTEFETLSQSISKSTTDIDDATQQRVKNIVAEMKKFINDAKNVTRGGYHTDVQAQNLTTGYTRSQDRIKTQIDDFTAVRNELKANGGSQQVIQQLDAEILALQQEQTDLSAQYSKIVDAAGNLVNTSIKAKQEFEKQSRSANDTIEAAKLILADIKDSDEYKAIAHKNDPTGSEKATKRADASFLSSSRSQYQRAKSQANNSQKIDYSQVDLASGDKIRKRLEAAESKFLAEIEVLENMDGTLTSDMKERVDKALLEYLKEVEIAIDKTTGGFKKGVSASDSLKNKTKAVQDKASTTRENLRKQRKQFADAGANDQELQPIDDLIQRVTDASSDLQDVHNKVFASSNKIKDTTAKTKREYEDTSQTLKDAIATSQKWLDIHNKAPAIYEQATKALEFYKRNIDSISNDNSDAAAIGERIRNLVGSQQNFYGMSTEDLTELNSLLPRFDTLTKGLRQTLNDTAAGSTKAAGKINDLQHKVKEYIETNTRLKRDPALYNSFVQLYEAAGRGESTFTDLNTEFKKYQKEAQAAGLESDTLYVKMKKLFFTHFSSGIAVEAVQFLRRGLVEVYQNVKLVDDQMTELRKVTDLSDTGYKEYLKSAADQAKELGTTLDAVIESTATWARLGYNMSESQDLSKAATVYMNVGDGLENATEATETLISTMKAFKIEASDSMEVVDAFNEVGNNFSISSAGIGEALTRSSSALAAANNTLAESIALVVAGMFHACMCRNAHKE